MSNTRSPKPSRPPAALKHLEILKAMADDPDAGVRRELILALRNLPTDQVGDSLRKLAASWDGQDRWYLEALGLALENRESAFCRSSSTARFMATWIWIKRARTAMSRFRRISRSIATRRSSRPGTPDLPVNAVSKNLGLAWRIHRREVLPLIERICPTCRRSSCNRPPTIFWNE